MGARNKEGADDGVENGPAEGRVRFELELEDTEGVDITRERLAAAFNQAFGPDHGIAIISITRKEEVN